MISIVCSARDGVVDSLACGIVDEGEGSSRIRNGGVAGTVDGGTVDGGGGAGEHPEALGIVDCSVVRGLAAESLLVDVTKSVERGALVGVFRVVDGTEVGRKEFLFFGDVLLGDHVFDGGRYRFREDSVDGAERETEKAIAGALFELRGEGLGELDGLVFDCQAADCDIVGADGA